MLFLPDDNQAAIIGLQFWSTATCNNAEFKVPKFVYCFRHTDTLFPYNTWW